MTTKKKVPTKLKQVTNTRTAFVEIKKPSYGQVAVEIKGTAPLIQNNFSQKAIEEMLAKHMGRSVQREKKNPRQILRDAMIMNTDDRVSIPPVAIKKGMRSSAAQVKGVKGTHLATGIFVMGGSLPITYESIENRMDMVRTSGIGRTPDVRFRPSFLNWSCRLVIHYSDMTFAAETIMDLLGRAGNVGVGEWRPEKNGSFGTFVIDRVLVDDKEIDEVLTECSVPLKPTTIPDWALDADFDPTDMAGYLKELEKEFETSEEPVV